MKLFFYFSFVFSLLVSFLSFLRAGALFSPIGTIPCAGCGGCLRFSVQRRRPQAGHVEQEKRGSTTKSGFRFSVCLSSGFYGFGVLWFLGSESRVQGLGFRGSSVLRFYRPEFWGPK